jgi:hypothetical protein
MIKHKIVYVEFAKAICVDDQGDEWYIGGIHENESDAIRAISIACECGIEAYYQPMKMGYDTYPIRVGDKKWIVCGIGGENK